jgi:putative ABC transport system substrate-binding protein
LGYVEDRNIIVEYRYADERLERLPALTEDLVRLKVEIIVADTTSTARAASKVTSTIPIIIASGSDPVQSGLAVSLARPGGNVTGVTNFVVELLGKRLELLKEVVPKVIRFAFLDDDDIREFNKSELKYAQEVAKGFGAKLDRIEVRASNPDFEAAFRLMSKERIGGLLASSGQLGFTLRRRKILELAEKTRMPAIYTSVTWIDDGGLMYYGPHTPDNYRRAATYVDKILKGAKPAELPVERPMKLYLGINLRAAKNIRLTIPPNLLARADRVIR